MYGYIIPDKTKIKQEEFVLFNAFYCGICKTIGNKFGQILRYTTNYDIAFFATLIFDQTNTDVEFVFSRCIGNPINKKATIKQNPLLERIADANLILAHYKLQDNLADNKRGAKTALKFINKHYQNAKKREPQIEQICQIAHRKQTQLEQQNEQSIDIASDCFAIQLRQIAQVFLGENAPQTHPNTLSLCYNIGKFVYLADALDDIDEDFKKGTYNPFLTSLGTLTTRTDFIKTHFDQINFALTSTVNRAIESFNGIKFNQSYGLLENIVYYGLRAKTQELLNSKQKLKKPKL